MHAMFHKLKSHFLTEANKDKARGLTHPSALNVLASVLCALLLLAWGVWCWRLGYGAWESGQSHYRTQEVSAVGSPIRHGLVVLGSLGLGAFSIDAAVQYAVEAVMRIRRRLRLYHGQ